MKQYSLFIPKGEDIEILENFAYLGMLRTAVWLVSKSYGGLNWPTVLWTPSERVYDVIGMRAGKDHLQVACALPTCYITAARHGNRIST